MARVGIGCLAGITGLKTPERVAALHRLIEDGKVLLIGIQEHPGKEFFIRTGDWEIQAAGLVGGQLEDRYASFLAPLDNMLWDRGLVQLLFDFSYTWEVYKPQPGEPMGTTRCPFFTVMPSLPAWMPGWIKNRAHWYCRTGGGSLTSRWIQRCMAHC